MSQKIVIAGLGFAGMWASLAAARAVSMAGKEGEVEVINISPTPNLAIRPRLYELELVGMNPDCQAVFDAVGVRHVPGLVETIDGKARTVTVARAGGGQETLNWDRFVLAVGSQAFRPPVPGLADFGFETDQLDTAYGLDDHLKALASRPETEARNTVVVAGAGLTGLETATEMPLRLRAALGSDTAIRVIIVDGASVIGEGMGPDALPYITEALTFARIEPRAGMRVAKIEPDAVTLSSGERIATNTVVWAAGMRANPLAAQIAGEHDELGRVIGDAYLHAPAENGVFVTGDTVKVATDELGNFNPMSCQHAVSLGRVAGYNAAAELVGLPLHPYSQPKYVTCLDLGAWGAIYTEGWDRKVAYTLDQAKKIKQEINTVWIYPPAADRDAVFAVAKPDFVVVP
jgi:NADH dehydrogenase